MWDAIRTEASGISVIISSKLRHEGGHVAWGLGLCWEFGGMRLGFSDYVGLELWLCLVFWDCSTCGKSRGYVGSCRLGLEVMWDGIGF